MRQKKTTQCLLLCLSCLLLTQQVFIPGEAKGKAVKIPQKNFLPPVATINGNLPKETDLQEGVDNPLEPVTLSAISSPTLKVSKPVMKLDNDLGVRTTTDEFQELLRSQKSLEEEDLRALWDATVEKNPVIRFSLEKLATPRDLQPKKSSQFLNKTLNVLISGAAIAATAMPGGSYYRNAGAMASGDALRNIINGNTHPQGEALSPTEQIQLAGLVDELQAKLVKTYHDYKNTLQALISAQQETANTNKQYTAAIETHNDLAILATSAAYYKALMNETDLRQKAKLDRLRLERLAGSDALADMKLSVNVTADITQKSQPEQAQPAKKQPPAKTTPPATKTLAPATVVAPPPAPEKKKPIEVAVPEPAPEPDDEPSTAIVPDITETQITPLSDIQDSASEPNTLLSVPLPLAPEQDRPE